MKLALPLESVGPLVEMLFGPPVTVTVAPLALKPSCFTLTASVPVGHAVKTSPNVCVTFPG